jgi:hypothetical protein
MKFVARCCLALLYNLNKLLYKFCAVFSCIGSTAKIVWIVGRIYNYSTLVIWMCCKS